MPLKQVSGSRRAKEHAESIIDTLPEPLLVLTPDLTVRSANQAFYQHFEVDPDSTVGRRIYSLGNGQWNIPALRRLLEDVLPDNDTFEGYEVEHKFEHLGRRVMRLDAHRLNQMQLILLGIVDITEGVLAQRAVQQSEARLRAMVDVQGVGILTFNSDGTLIDANQGFLEMSGYRREDVESHQLTRRSMTPPVYLEASEKQLARVAESGRIGPYEKEYLCKDGTRAWMLFAGAKVRDDIVEYCIDIGDCKRAERALRESEARYSSIVNQNRAGILQIGIDGAVQWANDHFCHQVGFTAEELEGRSIADFVHPEHIDESSEQLRRMAETGQPFEQDKRLVRKDGEVYWVHNAISPVRDESGKVTRATVLSLDVTERREAEAAQRVSEAQYRDLFESIDQGFCIFEVLFDDQERPVDYRFKEVNPAFERHT